MHACKVLDFVADDGDTALVGSVEFEDTGFNEFGAVELFGEGENGRSFARAWWAVEEHVRQLLLLVVVLRLMDVCKSVHYWIEGFAGGL